MLLAAKPAPEPRRDAAPSGLTTAEYVALALDCLDQACLSRSAMRAIADAIEDARPYACDEPGCGGFGCAACSADAGDDDACESDGEEWR